MKTFSLYPALLQIALFLPPSLLAAADFVWTGAADSGFSTPGNWASASTPSTGATIRCGKFYVVNGDKNAFTYTEKEGTTVVECDDFKIGSTGSPGGTMWMSGGDLTIVSRWSPMVAHNNNRISTLTITGGRLTIRSAPGARESELNFRFGNARGANTRGVLTMSGGFLVVETPGNAITGGLVIGNEDAHGEVLLEGGMMVVTSIYGTSFQAAEGNGVGILTLGHGDGVFMQTDSRQLTFGSAHGGAASHIDFLPDSKGQLSLAGATREDYESWVHAGRIRINGRKATPDRFKYTLIEGQGIYQLASDR